MEEKIASLRVDSASLLLTPKGKTNFYFSSSKTPLISAWNADKVLQKNILFHKPE